MGLPRLHGIAPLAWRAAPARSPIRALGQGGTPRPSRERPQQGRQVPSGGSRASREHRCPVQGDRGGRSLAAPVHGITTPDVSHSLHGQHCGLSPRRQMVRQNRLRFSARLRPVRSVRPPEAKSPASRAACEDASFRSAARGAVARPRRPARWSCRCTSHTRRLRSPSSMGSPLALGADSLRTRRIWRKRFSRRHTKRFGESQHAPVRRARIARPCQQGTKHRRV